MTEKSCQLQLTWEFKAVNDMLPRKVQMFEHCIDLVRVRKTLDYRADIFVFETFADRTFSPLIRESLDNNQRPWSGFPYCHRRFPFQVIQFV